MPRLSQHRGSGVGLIVVYTNSMRHESKEALFLGMDS